MPNDTILVVDDEPLEREGWSRALRLAGYQVYTAANADEALALCDAHDFDCVVVDFLMPQLDGVALLGLIRKKQPLTRSVLVSGKIDRAVDEVEIARQAREAVEADTYLHKPVSNDRLIQAITELIAGGATQTWKAVGETVTREQKRSPKASRELAKALSKLTRAKKAKKKKKKKKKKK